MIEIEEEGVEPGWPTAVWLWLAASFLFGVAAGVTAVSLSGRLPPAAIVITPAAVPTLVPTMTPAPLEVFVSGEVMAPAVYALPAGSRVEDALVLAGGLTQRAAAGQINLAQPLADGMQIYVPAVSLVEATPPPVRTPLGSDPPGDVANGLVNLNTADRTALETLPRIGPSTAQKILDYRDANGPFGSIDELMNVSGIGPATFERLAPLITIEE